LIIVKYGAKYSKLWTVLYLTHVMSAIVGYQSKLFSLADIPEQLTSCVKARGAGDASAGVCA
jgi:hypothetical protein